MQLSSNVVKDVLVIKVDTNRIDAAGATHLKDQFRDITNDFEGRVLMDLKNVEFMDSSGLGAMVSALKLLEGRKLELADLQPAVAKVFALTRMDNVFLLHASVDEGLDDTKGHGADAA